ncbi:MAG: succinate dehydrogenase, hydrophobic membrane anchor protein [Gammaproteobacteria bacterium]|nr:succinate dehydrogenase, hydrophobic membrane anchor protein [Gammaproteobacteria bacterium]
MSLQAQGMRTWLLQRLTAVYIAVYSLFLIVWILLNFPINYSSWYSFFSHPVILISTVIFYLSLFIHAWVGVRDILVDYAKPSSVRFILLTVLALFLLVMATWLLLIVISLVKV